jgi:hypothetical protein
MNSPQNRYDLLVAAQNTAVKNLTVTNERNLVRDIGTDFDELKIDDGFFEDFNRQVRDRISTYNHLKSQKLVAPAAPPIAAAAKA